MAKRSLNHVTIPTQIALLVGVVAVLGTVVFDKYFGQLPFGSVILSVGAVILGISIFSAIVEVLRKPGSLLTTEGREAALEANERGVRAAMDTAAARVAAAREDKGALDA